MIILQYDLEMNFIKEWCSMKELVMNNNYNKSTIYHCIRKNLKDVNNTYNSYGFIWKYKDKKKIGIIDGKNLTYINCNFLILFNDKILLILEFQVSVKMYRYLLLLLI